MSIIIIMTTNMLTVIAYCLYVQCSDFAVQTTVSEGWVARGIVVRATPMCFHGLTCTAQVQRGGS